MFFLGRRCSYVKWEQGAICLIRSGDRRHASQVGPSRCRETNGRSQMLWVYELKITGNLGLWSR